MMGKIDPRPVESQWELPLAVLCLSSYCGIAQVSYMELDKRPFPSQVRVQTKLMTYAPELRL